MTLDNGSASGTERLFACPASIVLPRVHRTNEYSERGNDLHEFVRAVLTGTPPETAIVNVDEEHRDTCRRIDWQRLGGDLSEVECEAAYALDPFARTARFLGHNIGRNYEQFALTPNEVPGSLDIMGVRLDGVLVVLDVKTGHGDVTDAAHNGQGLFFAAVLQLLSGAPEVEFRIAKLRLDGAVFVDSHTFTRLDVDSFLDEYEAALLAARAARRVYLAGGTPDVSEGAWCKYCESQSFCSAKVNLAKSMLSDMTDIAARVSQLSVEQAGAAWVKAEQVAAVLKQVQSALRSRAETEPLPTSPGKVVRAISCSTARFSAPDAIALLKEKGVSDAEIAGLYRTSAFTQVRETSAVLSRASANRARKGKAA